MNTIIRPLTAFPLLTESIKQAIGLSVWHLYRHRHRRTDKNRSLIDQLDIEANEALTRYIIPHQDCWILNAKSATRMYVEIPGTT